MLTIKEGNPHLKDQLTDSYEMNLQYHRKKVTGGIILYDRETRNLESSSYSVINGVSVFTLINAGRRRDRGAELDLSMPVVKRVKLSASLNLFDERVPVDTVRRAFLRIDFRIRPGLAVHVARHEAVALPDAGAVRAALAVFERLAAEYPAVPAYRQELANSRLGLALLLALTGDHAILELKYHRTLPRVFEELIDRFQLTAQPISKYRIAAAALHFDGVAAEA